MSLFNSTIIDLIKKSAYWADKSIRSELALGYIADENDYTSNFTAEFRRQINAKTIPNVTAISYKINGSLERKTGTDACIVFANDAEAKLCLFEAKLPRLSKKLNGWDSNQKSTGNSHFSSQLQRQCKFSATFIIWEMFYCDYAYTKQPQPFLNDTSSCILHKEAHAFDNKRIIKTAWTDNELIDLHNNSTVYQVDDIIKSVCECSLGEAIPIDQTDSLLNELQKTIDVLFIKYSEYNENS
jgi:hypothetical protein